MTALRRWGLVAAEQNSEDDQGQDSVSVHLHNGCRIFRLITDCMSNVELQGSAEVHVQKRSLGHGSGLPAAGGASHIRSFSDDLQYEDAVYPDPELLRDGHSASDDDVSDSYHHTGTAGNAYNGSGSGVQLRQRRPADMNGAAGADVRDISGFTGGVNDRPSASQQLHPQSGLHGFDSTDDSQSQGRDASAYGGVSGLLPGYGGDA